MFPCGNTTIQYQVESAPKIIQKSTTNKTQTPQYQTLNPKINQNHSKQQQTTTKPKNNALF